MRKAIDERANSVDNKLAEIAAVQRQISDQVSGLLKESAEETGKALDCVLSACTAAIQSAMANKADEKVKVKNTTGGGSAPEVSALPTILPLIIN